LVADNRDQEDVTVVVMSDDGTGGNLMIPSLLISARDANIMKGALTDSKTKYQLQVKITFEMKHPTNEVSLDIWMSSDLPVIRDFMFEFAAFGKEFSNS
jgi:hypothetical protein